MKICFLVRKLDLGGAERQLLSLVKALPKDRFDITVIEFYDGGALVPELLGIPGVKRICLHKGRRWSNIIFVRDLVGTLKALKPDVLHGYLDVPNILVVLAQPFLSKKTKIVMGLRSSNVHLQIYDRVAAFCAWAERKLSPYADLVIANSHAGRNSAVLEGYPEEKVVVVHNGVDSHRFYPSEALRAQQRSQWEIRPNQLLIGMVARFDPKKNHSIFLQACKLFLEKHPNTQFVHVGGGGNSLYRQRVHAEASTLGLDQHLTWAGEMPSVCQAYNALDINTLCSNAAEGFPNAVAEAMACGVPCITTASGDAAQIVGDLGLVIPEASAEAICLGWETLIKQDINLLRSKVAERIKCNFSVEALAQNSGAWFIKLSNG